jgi:nucleoside-diphosphate-sugar epimerase
MILVTGGSGFIGSHLMYAMKDAEIINLDINKPSETFSKNHTYVQGDIRNIGMVNDLVKQCDTIIHLAAIWDDFVLDKEQYYSVNVEGTKNLIDAANTFRIATFINYSSVSVYGNSVEECLETSVCKPVNDYGKSKLLAETLFEDLANNNPKMKIIHLRPSVVFGANNFGNIYRLIKQIKSGLYFNIGRKNTIKSVSYVENLVQGTKFLVENAKPGIEIFNYADKPHLSTTEISDIICSSLGRRKGVRLPYWCVYTMALPFDVIIAVTRINLPVSTTRVKKICTPTKNNCDKLLKSGFIPKFSSKEGLQKTVRWVLDN